MGFWYWPGTFPSHQTTCCFGWFWFRLLLHFNWSWELRFRVSKLWVVFCSGECSAMFVGHNREHPATSWPEDTTVVSFSVFGGLCGTVPPSSCLFRYFKIDIQCFGEWFSFYFLRQRYFTKMTNWCSAKSIFQMFNNQILVWIGSLGVQTTCLHGNTESFVAGYFISFSTLLMPDLPFYANHIWRQFELITQDP